MQIPISHLSVHPAVTLAWEMPDDHPGFLSLVESIKEQGLLEPLKITAAKQVVDGRHRLRACRAAGFESVECIVVPDDRVGEIAVATLFERRHMVTRGQLAYAAYPLFAAGHRELQRRNAELIKRGAQPGESSTGSVEGYASAVGVSRDLFLQAARLHELFDADPELRAEWEPKIMAPEMPIGLGAAIAGIRGQETSVGRTPQRNSALHNWEVAWRNITRPAGRWNRWTEQEREYATTVLRDEFAKLPDPVLDAVRDALRATRRQRAGGDSPEGKLERIGLLSRRRPAPDDEEEGDQDEPATPSADNSEAANRMARVEAKRRADEARARITAAAKSRWAQYKAERRPGAAGPDGVFDPAAENPVPPADAPASTEGEGNDGFQGERVEHQPAAEGASQI